MEHEQLFPGRQTYARYLHIAEAVAEDEAQAAWDGLGGRLKALRREVATGQAKAEITAEAGQAEAEAKAVARQAELEAGLADVKAEVKADMAEVKADMEEVKAGQAEVKTEMADMKALLEKLVAQSLHNEA